MQLYPASEVALAISMQDGYPKVCATHQMFQKHLQWREGNKQDMNNFGLALKFFLEFGRMSGGNGCAFTMEDIDSPSFCRSIGQGFQQCTGPRLDRAQLSRRLERAQTT